MVRGHYNVRDCSKKVAAFRRLRTTAQAEGGCSGYISPYSWPSHIEAVERNGHACL